MKGPKLAPVFILTGYDDFIYLTRIDIIQTYAWGTLDEYKPRVEAFHDTDWSYTTCHNIHAVQGLEDLALVEVIDQNLQTLVSAEHEYFLSDLKQSEDLLLWQMNEARSGDFHSYLTWVLGFVTPETFLSPNSKDLRVFLCSLLFLLLQDYQVIYLLRASVKSSRDTFLYIVKGHTILADYCEPAFFLRFHYLANELEASSEGAVKNHWVWWPL